MPALIQRVARNLDCHAPLARGQGVLVAVSGGVDSMVLLRVLVDLAPARGWNLMVGHLDHGLRGVRSREDRKFVERAGAELGLAVVAERWVDGRRQRGESMEMAARRVRHEFLARTAMAQGGATVCLAHHADDQLELFFLRLLRGAGASGLGGMRWQSPSPADPLVRLIRPLIDVSKPELEAYAARHGIRFREDETNRSVDPLRNRIRRGLIPLLRAGYQPGLAAVVAQTMEVLRGLSDHVESEAREWLRGKAGGAAALPVAVQREVIRLKLVEAGLEPGFRLVEELRQAGGLLVNLDADRRIRWNAEGELEVVSIEPAELEGQGEGACDVDLAATAGQDFGGVKFRWTFSEGRPRLPVRPVVGQERFDAGKVGSAIRLRFWRPGDRFQPVGMGEAVKLQDLFVNAKIPRAQRGKVVVAEAMDGRIFWVEGLRIGEQFKLDNATRRQLKWCWRRS